MHSLLVERSHRVLLARFSGTIRLEDMTGISEVGREFAAKEGEMRLLVDMTSVTTVDFTTAQLVAFAQQVSTQPSRESVFVAPTGELFGLSRMFGGWQRHGGNREPTVVRTLAEAYEVLSLVDPDFEPAI